MIRPIDLHINQRIIDCMRQKVFTKTEPRPELDGNCKPHIRCRF